MLESPFFPRSLSSAVFFRYRLCHGLRAVVEVLPSPARRRRWRTQDGALEPDPHCLLDGIDAAQRQGGQLVRHLSPASHLGPKPEQRASAVINTTIIERVVCSAGHAVGSRRNASWTLAHSGVTADVYQAMEALARRCQIWPCIYRSTRAARHRSLPMQAMLQLDC